ncbi:MAG: Crp/Fnr family transcriptional regulator [Bacteroidetes bacterium]|nr:Crp/Fnr family transcriptional regulator [Bacteroidota bacterium]
MQIDYDILIAYGGITKKYNKGAVLFREGSMPRALYLIVEGKVKLFSAKSENKELVQGIFQSGESFGEPPLLLDKCYPSTAQVISKSIIVSISKDKFLNILKDYPDIANKMLYVFAERIYKKAFSLRVLISHTSEEKILTFFDEIKGSRKGKIPIDFTRQQLADYTGMRVETVIRALMKLQEKGTVNIINRKVYY